MYNHLTLQMYDPTLAPQATMWGGSTTPSTTAARLQTLPTCRLKGATPEPQN